MGVTPWVPRRHGGNTLGTEAYMIHSALGVSLFYTTSSSSHPSFAISKSSIMSILDDEPPSITSDIIARTKNLLDMIMDASAGRSLYLLGRCRPPSREGQQERYLAFESKTRVYDLIDLLDAWGRDDVDLLRSEDDHGLQSSDVLIYSDVHWLALTGVGVKADLSEICEYFRCHCDPKLLSPRSQLCPVALTLTRELLYAVAEYQYRSGDDAENCGALELYHNAADEIYNDLADADGEGPVLDHSGCTRCDNKSVLRRCVIQDCGRYYIKSKLVSSVTVVSDDTMAKPRVPHLTADASTRRLSKYTRAVYVMF